MTSEMGTKDPFILTSTSNEELAATAFPVLWTTGVFLTFRVQVFGRFGAEPLYIQPLFQSTTSEPASTTSVLSLKKFVMTGILLTRK